MHEVYTRLVCAEVSPRPTWPRPPHRRHGGTVGMQTGEDLEFEQAAGHQRMRPQAIRRRPVLGEQLRRHDRGAHVDQRSARPVSGSFSMSAIVVTGLRRGNGAAGDALAGAYSPWRIRRPRRCSIGEASARTRGDTSSAVVADGVLEGWLGIGGRCGLSGSRALPSPPERVRKALRRLRAGQPSCAALPCAGHRGVDAPAAGCTDILRAGMPAVIAASGRRGSLRWSMRTRDISRRKADGGVGNHPVATPTGSLRPRVARSGDLRPSWGLGQGIAAGGRAGRPVGGAWFDQRRPLLRASGVPRQPPVCDATPLRDRCGRQAGRD